MNFQFFSGHPIFKRIQVSDFLSKALAEVHSKRIILFYSSGNEDIKNIILNLKLGKVFLILFSSFLLILLIL